jgi:hypothetical protein
LHDRIVGEEMGKVKLTPPVDEKISELAKRTATIGINLMTANGAKLDGNDLTVTVQTPVTQSAELFTLADLMKYWNPDWRLERAGFGGAGGGVGNIRGITHLKGDVLATWPRDSVRGVVLRRTVKLAEHPSLSFQVAADAARAWELEVYAGNKNVLRKQIDGGTGQLGERQWQDIKIDLIAFAGKDLELRLYQRVLLADKIPGNAYWKDIRVTN